VTYTDLFDVKWP